MLQWVDDLDDLVIAAGVLSMRFRARLLGLAGLTLAALSGIAIGLGIGGAWG